MENPHRNGGFTTMGVTKTNGHRSVKEPIAGPWDWRSNLPRCQHELDELRLRAAAEFSTNPDLGIHLGRWLRWVEGQAKGQKVGPTGNSSLARYRRFLYELNVDHEPLDRDPIHGPDVDLKQLPCAFGGVAPDAENARFAVAGSVNLAAA